MRPERAFWLSILVAGLVVLAAASWIPRDVGTGLRCWFLELTRAPCPFCGMTRTFLDAGHGQWKSALQQSPAGLVLYAGAWALALAGAIQVVRREPSRPPQRIPRWFWAAGIAALAINWLYRLIAGLR